MMSKLVPLDITQKFVFSGMDPNCSGFKDDYTEQVYNKTGCFGCKYLSIQRSMTLLTCGAKHSIIRAPVRKDENGNITKICYECTTSSTEYNKMGCRGCNNLAINMNRCALKYKIVEEIFRVG